jgi:hypothetical protein
MMLALQDFHGVVTTEMMTARFGVFLFVIPPSPRLFLALVRLLSST